MLNCIKPVGQDKKTFPFQLLVYIQEWFLAGAESLGRGGSGQDAEVHGGE